MDGEGVGHAGILDVARRAGVSPSTVSRSLRGASGVAEGTRERVMRAATDLAYVASPAASRLASGHSQAVGVVVPFLTRWYFAQVMSGVEAVLGAAGYDLLLYSLGDVTGRNSFFERLPVRRRVDAVLVLCLALDDGERSALRRLGLPVVTVGGGNAERDAGFRSVRIDDVRGTAQAVHHLLNLGHERIGMLSGDEDDPLGFTTSLQRRAGFEATMAEAGLEPSPDHVVVAPWGFEGGARAMEQLLTATRLPSAVFAESDEMAFGALRTLRRAGLRVPEDISLVGFDDHEFASVVELTTVGQPVRREGELAATLLLEALSGDAVTGAADLVLPTRLVVRGSTGRPPGGRRREVQGGAEPAADQG